MTPADDPLVSVVITNHNYGAWVEEAVRSVWAQTYPRVELVVVDDGSTDGSRETLQRLRAERDFELVYTSWVGAAAAKHLGVARSSGEFICPLDADDRIEPTFLARTMQTLRAEPGAAYCYTAIRYFGTYDRIEEPGPFDGKRLFLSGPYLPATVLMRRWAYDGTPGFRIRAAYEDWDLCLSLLDRGLVGHYLAEPLYLYRRHDGGRHRRQTRWQTRAIKFRHPRLLARYAVPQVARTGRNLLTLRPLRERLAHRRAVRP